MANRRWRWTEGGGGPDYRTGAAVQGAWRRLTGSGGIRDRPATGSDGARATPAASTHRVRGAGSAVSGPQLDCLGPGGPGHRSVTSLLVYITCLMRRSWNGQ